MKEIVVLSGKGGTGKTSLAAAFVSLVGGAVITDCDVDASNLHIILKPKIIETHPFFGGIKAQILTEACKGCGICMERCRFDAIDRIKVADNGRRYTFSIDPIACEGCGVCIGFCPHKAIVALDRESGKWFRSETQYGPFLHARLGVAAENSGKLVTMLRKEARNIANAEGYEWIITDGSPGIGCPVIASLTTADHILFVTEPTASGLHDLDRVVTLAKGFNIPGSVVINRADINPQKTDEIREYASNNGLETLGTIPYDPCFTKAQIAGRSVTDGDCTDISNRVRDIWGKLRDTLQDARK
jgi:MinD superfamily P-loop ATPase